MLPLTKSSSERDTPSIQLLTDKLVLITIELREKESLLRNTLASS